MTDTTYYPPKIETEEERNKRYATSFNGSNVTRKCPFRKRITFIGTFIDSEKRSQPMHNARWAEEEFLDCIGKECALWTSIGCCRL